MIQKTIIPLLPISMSIMSSKSVIKLKAFFKHCRGECMVDISDWYMNTFTPRRISYVPVKQNWQLLERGQLSYLIVIMPWRNSCLSLGEQEKEELQKPCLFLGSESGKHLTICLSHSCSVQQWKMFLKLKTCEVNRNMWLKLKGATRLACNWENTLISTELGDDLSAKDKGSQLPKESKASGEEGDTLCVPEEKGYDNYLKWGCSKVLLLSNKW